MMEPLDTHVHERPDPFMVASLTISLVNFALLLIVAFR